MKKSQLNMVQCLYCTTIVQSTHCHDFKTCACGHVSVDGGNEYHKRAWDQRPPNWLQFFSDGSETHIRELLDVAHTKRSESA